MESRLSTAAKVHRGRLRRLAAPLFAPQTVAVVSVTGGVGQTTVAALLALYLAEHHDDAVVAVDANPDAGTLGDRLLIKPARRTRSDLVNHRDEAEAATPPAEFGPWLEHVARLAVVAADDAPSVDGAAADDRVHPCRPCWAGSTASCSSTAVRA